MKTAEPRPQTWRVMVLAALVTPASDTQVPSDQRMIDVLRQFDEAEARLALVTGPAGMVASSRNPTSPAPPPRWPA